MVGVYDQWLVINSVRKEALKAKTLVGKLKDHLDELSETLSSTAKSTSKLKTMVAAVNKVADQAARKFISLDK